MLLIYKKILVEFFYFFIIDFSDVKLGVSFYGFIIIVKDFGCFVIFYNNVKGIVFRIEFG